MMDQILTKREQQLQIFEDYLRLEIHISIQYLPKVFNQMQKSLLLKSYQFHFDNKLTIQYQQQQFKIIQEMKRYCLNMLFRGFELQYQQYEKQFQQYFQELQSKMILSSNGSILLESFIRYLNFRTDRLKQVIYYERIPAFRKQLRRQRQDLRKKSKFQQQQIQVSPQVILDIHRQPFTTRELNYLSRGLMNLVLDLFCLCDNSR